MSDAATLPAVMFLYHPADESKVRAVVSMLQRAGVQPWTRLTHIRFGEDVVECLGKATECHSHVVLFVTQDFHSDRATALAVSDLIASHSNLLAIPLLYDGAAPPRLLRGIKAVSNAEQMPAADIASIIVRTLEGRPIAHGCTIETPPLPLSGALVHGVDLMLVRSQAGQLSPDHFRNLLRRAGQKPRPQAPTLVVVGDQALAAPLASLRHLADTHCPPNTAIVVSFPALSWQDLTDYTAIEPGADSGGTCAATVTWARGAAGSPLTEHLRSHLGQTPDRGGVLYPSQPCFHTVDGANIGILGLTCEDNAYADTTRQLAGAYATALTVRGLFPDLTILLAGPRIDETAARHRLLEPTNGAHATRCILSPVSGATCPDSTAANPIPVYDDGMYRCRWTTTGFVPPVSHRPVKGRGFGAAEPILSWGLFRRAIGRSTVLPQYDAPIRNALRNKRVRVRRQLVLDLDEHTQRDLLATLDPTVTQPMEFYVQAEGRKLLSEVWKVLSKVELAGPVEFSPGQGITGQWRDGGSLTVLAGSEGSRAHSVVQDYLSRLHEQQGDAGLNPFQSLFTIVLDGFGGTEITDYSPSEIEGASWGGAPSQVYYCTLAGMRSELGKAKTCQEIRTRFRRGR